MVLGDSIAVDMAPAVRSESAPLRYRPYAAGVLGCVAGGSVMVGNPDLVRACFLFRAGWSDLVRRERPDVVVLMRQSLVQPGGSVPGVSVCDPAYRTWYRARLREDVTALSVTGATVVLTTAPYARFVGVVNVTADRELACANEEIRTVARTQHRAALVDLAAWVCPGGECRTHHDDVVLRPDGLHFSGAGAQVTMRHLYGQIYK
jgi:hypothetical protein